MSNEESHSARASATKELRDYQVRSYRDVHAHWDAGRRRVLLVLPTGGGKTFSGTRIACDRAGDMGPVLWVAHRRELVTQAYKALHAEVGGDSLGIVAPGHDFNRAARVQVGTVQTFLARKWSRAPSIMVLDEAHHYVSSEWNALPEAFPTAETLGLTATPERSDGSAMGDLFDALVVGATYSELLESGHLTDACTFQSPEVLKGAFALSPLEAWQRHAEGSQTFAFMPSVKVAKEWCDKFNEAGVRSALITGTTKSAERRESLELFNAGVVKVLFNVNVLTEGVDCPAARCVILGRAFNHSAAFLQAVGRILRPHPDKPHGIVIDLVGATMKHGFATEDRVYSLRGTGIRRSEGGGTPVRNCKSCGMVYLCSQKACPGCGEQAPPSMARPPRIFSLELRELWRGEHTADDVKVRELKRLREVCATRGWSVAWAISQYKKTFGDVVKIPDASPQERAIALEQLNAWARQKGFKRGFVYHRFRDMFGVDP